jgi:hypothetical protein
MENLWWWPKWQFSTSFWLQSASSQFASLIAILRWMLLTACFITFPWSFFKRYVPLLVCSTISQGPVPTLTFLLAECFFWHCTSKLCLCFWACSTLRLACASSFSAQNPHMLFNGFWWNFLNLTNIFVNWARGSCELNWYSSFSLVHQLVRWKLAGCLFARSEIRIDCCNIILLYHCANVGLLISKQCCK